MGIPIDAFCPDIDDETLANAGLYRVTEVKLSDCWNGEFPIHIDHIVLYRLATEGVFGGTFRQFIYPEGETLEKKLSDYCQISFHLNGNVAFF